MLDQEHTISVSRRTVRLALAFAVVLAVLAPVAVIAAGGTFVDDDTSIFEDDIEWLVANGVTSGCGTDTYCPEDNVTRGQMAAFMKRLATNKVVDAATAVTAESATTADSATSADTAADASRLDGLNSTEYALGLIGFDSSNTSQTVAVSAEVTMASVELDIPRRCSLLQTETVEVLVIGSGYFNGTTGPANGIAQLGADTVVNSNTWVSINVDDDESRTPYTTQWVFEVSPGVHTFEMTSENIGPNSVLSWWPKLSAQALGSTCDSIVVLPSEPTSKGEGPDGQ